MEVRRILIQQSMGRSSPSGLGLHTLQIRSVELAYNDCVGMAWIRILFGATSTMICSLLMGIEMLY